MLEMPVLQTARLLIRPFELGDLESVHQLFDFDLDPLHDISSEGDIRQKRADWLAWASMNHQQLAELDQPPLGDRAILLRETGSLIGSVGFVPCLAPFAQLPNFDYYDPSASQPHSTFEVGLFYAISPIFQRKNFATEAALAMLDYAFRELHLKQVIATTEYDNLASQGVMLKLGMTIEKNPLSEPPWLQVVGVLKNDLL